MNLNAMVKQALKDRAENSGPYIKYAFYADENSVCLTGYPQTSLGWSEKPIVTVEYHEVSGEVIKYKFTHL